MTEPTVHKMPQRLVAYFYGDDKWTDPHSSFTCGTCMMRVLDSAFHRRDRRRADCTAVKTDHGVLLPSGGCIYFMAGPGAKPDQINPHRLTAEDALYSEDGPFSCRRCRHLLVGKAKGKEFPNACHRVHEDRRGIDPLGCCDAWEALPGRQRRVVSAHMRRIASLRRKKHRRSHDQ